LEAIHVSRIDAKDGDVLLLVGEMPENVRTVRGSLIVGPHPIPLEVPPMVIDSLNNVPTCEEVTIRADEEARARDRRLWIPDRDDERAEPVEQLVVT
jgi:hypothetical protein